MSIFSDMYNANDYEAVLAGFINSERQDILRGKAERASYDHPEIPEDIIPKIVRYYGERELRWPTFEEAREWAKTEEGEVSEQWLARIPGWVRNNPLDHKPFSEEQMIEELADQVFMLLVAGMVKGYNLLDVMNRKMDRKLKEYREKIQRSE
jgi:hypothetical protein